VSSTLPAVTSRRSADEVVSVAAELTDRRLMRLLNDELARWAGVDSLILEPLESLRELIAAGGKRLRPAFCYWAFVGAGGDPDDGRLADMCAALEMLHVFALIHDDVMDASDLRRGEPTVHRRFEHVHQLRRWSGCSEHYGSSIAILVGDLAMTYATLLVTSAPAPVVRLFTELELEMCAGQFLDITCAARRDRELGRAMRIARLKSGKYTVERPLHLGAALAGHGEVLAPHLSAFGLPLGDAFQLLDDVLGMFGDPLRTGKPVGSDLREGKLTALIALCGEHQDAERVLARMGAPDLSETEVAEIQAFVRENGAYDAVVKQIDQLLDEALDALAASPLRPDAIESLRLLADVVTSRDS